MSDIDTRWFQNRLADIRLSQRKLASMLNLDPAAVSLMFRGKRKMSAAEAAEIANLLNVSTDEVLMRAGATMATPERPRVGAVAGAGGRTGDVPLVVVHKPKSGPGHYGMRAADVQTAPASVGQGDMGQAHAAGPLAGFLEVPVPMSDGSVAKLLLPQGMTKQDAQRIAALVNAFAVDG